MFANTSNNIQDPRLNKLRELFPSGEVNKERSDIASAALQALEAFKRSPESKGCNLFNESKDTDCLANFAAMESSIKFAIKNTKLNKVNGMLEDITARITPTLETDLKSFKAADPDASRQAAYDAAIRFASEIKIACGGGGQTNSPTPK
jgi:hypothetical protein